MNSDSNTDYTPSIFKHISMFTTNGPMAFVLTFSKTNLVSSTVLSYLTGADIDVVVYAASAYHVFNGIIMHRNH